MNNEAPTFRSRIRSGERLIGTFVKSAGPHVIEILASAGLDFVMIDEEHAPFDRLALDTAMLAARAWGIAPLVRIPTAAPERILSVLDMGGAGVMVPHVADAETAKAMVRASQFRGGARGVSNSGRAGDYSAMGLFDFVARQDDNAVLIAMIEDPAALDRLDEIMAVERIDAVFIGRGDLTVAFGEMRLDAPAVVAATTAIADAARRAGKRIASTAMGVRDATAMQALGVTMFVSSSDQQLLRRAATTMATELRGLAQLPLTGGKVSSS